MLESVSTIFAGARYTDLTVVCLTCSPAETNLGKGLRTLLRYCPRSVLVVSQVKSTLDKVLLAYDGSDLAQKALHTAAYLAINWDIDLAVLTAHEDHELAAKIQQRARLYLESKGIEAVYIIKKKNDIVEAILNTAKEQRSNLILMGRLWLERTLVYQRR